MSIENPSALYKAALAFAEAGIPVFPCVADGKRPVTEHGFKEATTDREQIAVWWGQADYNIGVCPEDAGWCVLDLDPGWQDAEFAARILELPETYEVTTPRGGAHLYFEGSLPPTANKLGKKIDTRGRNSYILVPPSVVNGNPYKVRHDRAIAPLPHWVEEQISRADERVGAALSELDLPGNVARGRSLLLGLVQRGDVAIAGRGGDDRTYRLACEILNLGLSPQVALSLLEELWNPHCNPPWTDDELRVKIENASRYAQNEAGAWAVPPAAEVFGNALDTVANLPEPEARSRFHFEDEKEQEDGKEPTWLVKNVIAEASTVLLVGATQSYKSFLALDLALSISTGTATFGSPVPMGLTFYAALEGRANIKKARRRAWRVAHEISGPIENFYVGPGPIIGMPSEMQEFGDAIAKRCKGEKPKLIVIDTLSKSMAGLNENDAGDAGRFIRFCDSLVEAFGATVLVIHHTGKDDSRGARGSSAFHAGFDTVLEVKADRKTKAVEVWVRKHKDAEEPEFPFTFQGRALGNSLVFTPTTAEEHKSLTGKDDRLEPRKIGAALQNLNAYGHDQGVTTDVLARELRKGLEGEDVEATEAAVTAVGRSLAAQSKEKLVAYCTRDGRSLVWYLPAPAGV